MSRFILLKMGVAVAAFWATAACIKDIDWETDYQKQPVVNCVLCPDEVQTLRLSYNNVAGSNIFRDFQPIEHATATLWCNGAAVGTFKDNRYGRYRLDYRPVPGAFYRLEVRLEDGTELSAETSFPKTVSVNLDPDRKGDNFCRFFIQEDVRDPYWIFHLNRDEDILYFPPSVTGDDHLVTKIGTDHPDRDDFNTTGPLMFSDVMGSTKGKTLEHLAYLRIVPKSDKEPVSFCVEGLMNPMRVLIVVRSVSPEYDSYLKSALEKMHAHISSEDPTSWLEEVDTYSNIEGGLGIFGAWADRVLYISPIP